MIEVVYKDEKQHAKGNEGIFQLPRNVRQIGTTDQNYRVYMEDYVYTFLGRAAASGENKEEKERHLAVFMGETKWDAGTCYLFIRGAVLVSGGEISQEHIEFTDAMWQQIHYDAEKYFEGEEIVGWFLGGQDAADGSDGNDSSHTSQAFRRRKSADADGPGGKRRSIFSL